MTKIKQRSIKEQRKMRVRKKLFGTPERPRITVNKSNKYIYVQMIDDVNGKTLVSASGDKNMESAYKVGKELAEKATKEGIKLAVYDRSGYKYHGKVKQLADGARAGGLEF